LPGEGRALGLWRARDAVEIRAILKSLPMGPWMTPDVLTVDGDIADAATTDRIIEGALGRFGRIDTLVNNAGVFISKPFTDYTAEDYALVVGVNLTGFFWLTQRAIAEMVKRYGGHVVSIFGHPRRLRELQRALGPGRADKAAWPRPPGHWPSNTPLAAPGSTPYRRASSRRRCTRRTATTDSAAVYLRSGGSARLATSSTASCSRSHCPTSPARSPVSWRAEDFGRRGIRGDARSVDTSGLQILCLSRL